MNKNIYYVYEWIRLDTNKVFYIGKGHGNRYKDMSMRNKYFLNVVNKVGKENIQINIIESNLSEDVAFEREKYYIKYYKENGHPLTNMTNGGEGSSNWYEFLSEEEKEKHKEISKSFLGKKHTEETKRKMSQSAMGRSIMTEDGRKRLSEYAKNRPVWFKGHKHTEETKQKLREQRLGKPSKNAKEVYILDDKYNILKRIKSRQQTFDEYPNFNQSRIRKSLEGNSCIVDFTQAVFCEKYIFIYRIDYDKIKSQSTIETITLNEESM